jgi:hypothetical protein
MSQFAADFAAANDLLAESFGEAVSLVRAGVTATGVTTEVFTQDYQGENDEGIQTTITLTEFLVDVDDYDHGSGAVEPRGGDLIKRTIDGTVHTYEVTRAPNGKYCEWADTSNDQWKIHANHIDP